MSIFNPLFAEIKVLNILNYANFGYVSPLSNGLNVEGTLFYTDIASLSHGRKELIYFIATSFS